MSMSTKGLRLYFGARGVKTLSKSSFMLGGPQTQILEIESG